MTSALFLAIHDEDYPRNGRIREFLRSRSWTVVVVPVPRHGGYLWRCAKLALSGVRARPRPDVVFLAEFSLQYAWVAFLVARVAGATLVVDRFVGLVETNVEDWGRFAARSPRGLLHRLLDWVGLQVADLVLTDTEIRAASLTCRPRAISLPVGAPSWATPAPSSPRPQAPQQLRVLYYGNYIPLHGVPTIIEAVRIASSEIDIDLTMVGDGELRPQAEQAATALPRCTFLPPVAQEKLAHLIHQHDVVLGIFGDSEKASTVIANKVWQGLACGRVVVTRSSPALLEISELVKDRLIQVDPADAPKLAFALTRLAAVSTPDSCQRPDTSLEHYVTAKYDGFFTILIHLMRNRQHGRGRRRKGRVL